MSACPGQMLHMDDELEKLAALDLSSTSPTPNPTISSYWQQKYRSESGRSWDNFYKRNETRFFRDRHWIGHEFPELYAAQVSSILELGCGVGNFLLPLLEESKEAMIYGCDFSKRAIELLKQDERFIAAGQRVHAFVADITKEELCMLTGTVDIVTAIFVLSAISPENHRNVFKSVYHALRPGGILLFRDYGENDAAQLRFKDDRRLSESLFVRQDGTLAYYFGQDEFILLVRSIGFAVIECNIVLSRTQNIKRGIDVERRFLQAKIKRPF